MQAKSEKSVVRRKYRLYIGTGRSCRRISGTYTYHRIYINAVVSHSSKNHFQWSLFIPLQRRQSI